MSQIWYSASPSDAYLFFRPIPKNFPLKHYDWNFQDEPFGITWWTTGLINVTFWGGETARPISSPPPRRFTVALEIPKLRVAEKDCWCQENKDSLPRSFFSNFIGLHQQGLVSFDIYLSIKKWRFASSPKLVTHLDWPKNCLKKTTRREKKTTLHLTTLEIFQIYSQPSSSSWQKCVKRCNPCVSPRCNRWLENSAALQAVHQAHCPPKAAIQSQRCTTDGSSARWSLDMFRKKHFNQYIYIFMVHFTAK